MLFFPDRCPSPRENPECHFGLRNQCSNHSECDYIQDGMCCFDGCRRRCATPKGFPSRIEGIRRTYKQAVDMKPAFITYSIVNNNKIRISQSEAETIQQLFNERALE